jgi:hypothetical protein
MRRLTARQSTLIKKIKNRPHRIYGVFDYQVGKLIMVHLDREALEMEYDIGNYDEERFKIVTFNVILF